MNLLLMLLGFSLLVAVHELGHFLVARMMGMSVASFSIGFGPVLWRKQWGETEYRLSLIPLGGYVQIVGHLPDDEANQQFVDAIAEERGEESVVRMRNPSTWYCNKSGIAQFLTILAGPVFSLLLAIPLFWGALVVDGTIEFKQPLTISAVAEESPAAAAGFEAGDALIGFNGQPVSSYNDFVLAMSSSNLSEPIPVTVKRDGELINTTLSFPDSRQPRMGIGLEYTEVEYTPGEALQAATQKTADMIYLQAAGMYSLFTGKASTDSVSGPVGIFSIGSSAAGQGFGSFCTFLGLITVALGLFNLLPIPMLDGGHLIFATWKIVTGKNVPARVQTTLIFIGFVLMMTLVVLASYQDVLGIMNS